MQNHKSPAGARALIVDNCSHTTGHYNDRQRVLDLVQPVCAPTGTDHGRATPQSTPLALLVIVFLAGTSDCAASRRSFLVVGLVRLLGTTSRLRNWTGARGAKMAHGGSRRPSLH